jgi:hypothetical protein
MKSATNPGVGEPAFSYVLVFLTSSSALCRSSSRASTPWISAKEQRTVAEEPGGELWVKCVEKLGQSASAKSAHVHCYLLRRTPTKGEPIGCSKVDPGEKRNLLTTPIFS